MGALVRGILLGLVLVPFTGLGELWQLQIEAPLVTARSNTHGAPKASAPDVSADGSARAQATAQPPAQALKPVPVKIARAAPTPEAGRIITTGTITYKRELTLSFKTGGVVRAYAVDVGDPVNAGDPLISADPSDTAGRRGEAEAAFTAAKANLERAEQLHKQGFISDARLEDAKTAFKRAQGALNSARFDESRAALTATTDGVVLVRHAEIGQQMAPGAPVITIGDATSGLILRAPLGDRQVIRVRTGDPASVRLAGTPAALSGKVSRLGAKAHPLSGAFDVEVALGDAPPGLRSGLVAEAEISASGRDGTEKLLAIPAIAVLEGRGDEAYVYLIPPDNKARRVAVTIAGFAGGKVLLKQGLKAGDQVATSGAAYLRNGQPVTIVPDTWPEAAVRP